MNRSALLNQLEHHEGLRLKLYKDTEGILTIGVGRNIEQRGISDDEARYMLNNDIASAEKECQKYPWYSRLNDARQNVVCNMMFNLGKTRLDGFVNMLLALEHGAYGVAANEMMNSKWAKQVGPRANELAHQMLTGEL